MQHTQSTNDDDRRLTTVVQALRDCKAQGSYPVPEATFCKDVLQQLKRAGDKAVRAKDIAAAVKGLIQRKQIVKEKSRTTKGLKALMASFEDRALIYAIEPGEVQAAVAQERRRFKYPVSLNALATALKLTKGGKEVLGQTLEKMAAESDGLTLLWTGTGKTRKPMLVLKSEEGFARKLKVAEVLRLRIEHADLLRTQGTAASPRSEEPQGAATAIRERILAAYDELRRQEHKRSVPISRLRLSLPDFQQAAVDRELVALCGAELFELSVHDHQHLLTEAERKAQLVWPNTGRSYYYLARIE